MGPNRHKMTVPPIRPLAFAKFDKPAAKKTAPAGKEAPKEAAKKSSADQQAAAEKNMEPAKAPARHHAEEKTDG